MGKDEVGEGSNFEDGVGNSGGFGPGCFEAAVWKGL